MKKNTKISNKAFTLIELMVAIAIIGILAAVVLISMQSYGRKARASRVMAQVSSVIPSMVSCAGNGGTPQFGASGSNICSVITGASNYGQWPTFPTGYSIKNSNSSWSSASAWHLEMNVESNVSAICCSSAMNSCGQPTSPCSDGATWQ